MCLQSIMDPLKATREIVAYKVLMCKVNPQSKKEEWLTPYRFKSVTFGKTYRLRHLGKPTAEERLDIRCCTKYAEYKRGMYHTCVNLDAAEQLVNHLLDNRCLSNTGIAICEAIIPKGAMYVVGTASDLPTYGSDKIKYTRVLKAYARW